MNTTNNDAGRLVAKRYRLTTEIGAGGSGSVWQAEDLVTGSLVAVKLLYPSHRSEHSRVRQEVSALRLLRIPGVVELVDEGMDGAQPFLVMELARGRPFPGRRSPQRWEEIENTTAMLLETLSRIHAAGVVHRDLKPDNILVDEEGRPTVLDFGLSISARLEDRITRERVILGTPAYLAPEQITGAPVDVRTDLYAVGIILYEALTGRIPHDTHSFQGLVAARLGSKPRAIAEAVSSLPLPVASTIDRLIEKSPENRPRSASETLQLLRGKQGNTPTAHRFPKLGSQTAERSVLSAITANRSVRLIGVAGSGRTRCLADVAAELTASGRRVAWTQSSSAPFGSIARLIEGLDALHLVDLNAARSEFVARLSELLRSGTILFIDDIERLDSYSEEVLLQCRGQGITVEVTLRKSSRTRRPLGGKDAPSPRTVQTVHMPPLDEAELQPLFAGPERLFHLRSDAARILHKNTDGIPSRLFLELSAWERAGIARHNGAEIVVERTGLDRIEGALRLGDPRRLLDRGLGDAGVTLDDRDEVIAWLRLLWPQTSMAVVHAVIGGPLWYLEARVLDLIERGYARRLEDGRIEPLVAPEIDLHWSEEERRRAHRTVASLLSLGAEGRLFHLLAATDMPSTEDARDIRLESCAAATSLAAQGRMTRAISVLREGLSALRRIQGSNQEHIEAILSVWVDIAVVESTAHALDRVLYEIARSDPRSSKIDAMERMVRAALSTFGGGRTALDMVNSVPPFVDECLERNRQNVRVIAARRCSLQEEATVLDDVSAWAKQSQSPRTIGCVAAWRARLRYRQGRFEEAASLHAEAASMLTWMVERTRQLLGTASCLLEAFQHEGAAIHADRALCLATDARQPYFEARAQWLLRASAYRQCKRLHPDVDFVEKVALTGSPSLEAFVSLTEATIAWRQREPELGCTLARRANVLCTRTGNEPGALLSRALAIAAGARDLTTDKISEAALSCETPGVGLQVLALLSMGGADFAWPQRDILRLRAQVPKPHWNHRMDILSVTEAVRAVRAATKRGRDSGRTSG